MINIKTSLFTSLIGLFITTAAYAAPFSIMPNGPLPTTITSGATASASYTVTNMTDFNPPFNLVKWLPLHVSINPSGTTCMPTSAFPLGPGQSCILNLTISGPVDRNEPDPHHHLFVCMSDRVTCVGPDPENSLNVTPVPASTVVLTAAGEFETGGNTSLLVASKDGGITWALQSVTGAPPTGEYYASSCTGSGVNTICTAVGVDHGSFLPLLVVSTNGGATWSIKPPVTGDLGVFNGTSCTGSGSTAICIAVGTDDTSGVPLLAISTDGGVSWTVPTVIGAPSTGVYFGGSCSGSGPTAICVVGGTDATGLPLLVISTNGGVTWAAQPPLTGSRGRFSSTSCTGSGASAVCTAAGTTIISNSPLLAVSTNGGISWALQSVPGVTSGLFSSTSCTGSGASAVCTAAGTSGLPLLVISTNGGVTWAIQTVTGDSGYFFGTSCTGSGSTAICTAAGNDTSGPFEVPLLAVSTNGGATWSIKPPGTGDSGSFFGTSCTGSGSTAICTAAGQDFAGVSPPLLSVSTNGGNTWVVQPVVSTAGYFNGTGASQGFAKKFQVKTSQSAHSISSALN